eukprot:SAG22_NODE_15875_length_338_cov_0.748954_1_plen_30_part_10
MPGAAGSTPKNAEFKEITWDDRPGKTCEAV